MKVLLFANTGWYLYNFRRSLASCLVAQGFEVVLVSPPDAYGERLREMGFRWIPVTMDRRSLKPLREVVVLARLAKIYRAERPDVVHHFTLKCVVWGGIAAWLAGIPLVVSAITGLGYLFSSSSVKARLLRRGLVLALRRLFARPNSVVVVQNPDDAAELAKVDVIEPSRIRLIRSSGVDTARFRPPERPDRTGETVVLMACRLLWAKGVGEFVEVARRLRREGHPVRFRLAGTSDFGNPEAVPAAQLEQWAAEGYVEILGHVEDMPSEMARADIVALPSYYGEGVPRCLVEAAASGKPLVATDVAGCREIVLDSETGLLVPPRDVEALCEAIRRLRDDCSLRQRLGAAARAFVVAEFDETQVVARTIDLYAGFERFQT